MFHLYRFTQWAFSWELQYCHTLLGLRGFLKSWGEIYNYLNLAFFLPPNPVPYGSLTVSLGWTLTPLDHINISFYLQLLSRRKTHGLFPFINWSFSWVGSCPEGSFSIFSKQCRGIFTVLISTITASFFRTHLDCNIYLPRTLFLSQMHILYFRLPCLLLFIVDLCKVTSNNHSIDPMLSRLEQIWSLLFNSSSHKFSGHGQKRLKFFAKTSHKWPLA